VSVFANRSELPATGDTGHILPGRRQTCPEEPTDRTDTQNTDLGYRFCRPVADGPGNQPAYKSAEDIFHFLGDLFVAEINVTRYD
jgi:hypothetical protein